MDDNHDKWDKIEATNSEIVNIFFVNQCRRLSTKDKTFTTSNLVSLIFTLYIFQYICIQIGLL